MRNIQIDAEGKLRCSKCGAADSFISKRTFSDKAAGAGLGVVLAGPLGLALGLASSKKLKCQACGVYNQTGNAQPFGTPSLMNKLESHIQNKRDQQAAEKAAKPKATPELASGPTIGDWINKYKETGKGPSKADWAASWKDFGKK